MLLLLDALAWTCLIRWPWGQLLLPALVGLSIVHLAAPLYASWRKQSVLGGPGVIFALDVAFLYLAWSQESWGELTVVFAPLLLGVALVALAYSAAMMALLARIKKSRR